MSDPDYLHFFLTEFALIRTESVMITWLHKGRTGLCAFCEPVIILPKGKGASTFTTLFYSTFLEVLVKCVFQRSVMVAE